MLVVLLSPCRASEFAVTHRSVFKIPMAVELIVSCSVRGRVLRVGSAAKDLAAYYAPVQLAPEKSRAQAQFFVAAPRRAVCGARRVRFATRRQSVGCEVHGAWRRRAQTCIHGTDRGLAGLMKSRLELRCFATDAEKSPMQSLICLVPRMRDLEAIARRKKDRTDLFVIVLRESGDLGRACYACQEFSCVATALLIFVLVL